jgi:hypothetical protein
MYLNEHTHPNTINNSPVQIKQNLTIQKPKTKIINEEEGQDLSTILKTQTKNSKEAQQQQEGEEGRREQPNENQSFVTSRHTCPSSSPSSSSSSRVLHYVDGCGYLEALLLPFSLPKRIDPFA